MCVGGFWTLAIVAEPEGAAAEGAMETNGHFLGGGLTWPCGPVPMQPRLLLCCTS